MSANGADAPKVNPVGFTSQITAAFRAVELEHSTKPIIIDPLARHLSTSAWQLALRDWQQLVELQGAGKSLRVPARNRLMDDILLQTLHELQTAGHQRVQVVNIGCGMDSKPWRLQVPVKVTWFDVDQPGVMQCKHQLLQEAGAALTQQPLLNNHTDNTSLHHAAASQVPCSQGSESDSISGVQFPLLVEVWQPVAADLSTTALASCLQGHGFDASVPTVWLAEALLYYLPLDKAFQLLADMRALSTPGSKLIATCIDRELYIADHARFDKSHYFHAMWFFSIDDLVCSEAAQQKLKAAGWSIDMQPCTTAELAQARYGRATYVAVYGGAECIFTAGILCDL